MKNKTTTQIFIGMLLGILVGYCVHRYYGVVNFQGELSAEQMASKESLEKISSYFQLLSKIFLRMIQMILGPLVFSILTVGVAKLGDFKTVGRIGLKTITYFYIATILSLITGLIAVQITQPGKTINLDKPMSGASTGIEAKKMSLEGFITHVFPKSIFEALSQNEVLQIVVFSLFFGVALAAIGDKGKVLVKALDSLSEVMFKIVSYVMKFAPFAVFGSVSAVIASKGLGVLVGYFYLIIDFFGALLFFVFVVLWLICIMAKIPFWKLLKSVKSAVILSFSTASSEASMPLQIEQLRKFGIPDRIISFVLPLGYSFNLDGSMMYMTFATGFIAQIYGKEMSLGEQITMLLTLLLTSKGIAGVPRASLVVIAGTLSLFGLPQEGLNLVLAVDWLLDMGRSATSVMGNAVATAVVARWEGELHLETDEKK